MGVGRRASIHVQGNTKGTSVKPERIFGCVITVGPSTFTYISIQVSKQSQYKDLIEKNDYILKPEKYHWSMICMNKDKPSPLLVYFSLVRVMFLGLHMGI